MAAFRRAILFALAIGGLGFIVSNATVLQFLAAQNPSVDFILWYGLLAIWSAAVYYILFGRLISVRTDVAFLMFYFAIGTVFYWAASDAALQNAGIQSGGNVPSFLLASEDQLISSFFLWLGASPALAVALTYWVIPPVLVFLALMIAKNGVGLLKRFLSL